MNYKFESRKPKQIILSVLCHMTTSAGFYLAFLSAAYSKRHLCVRLEGTTAAVLHWGVRGESLELPSSLTLQGAPSSPVVSVGNDIGNAEVWPCGWIKGKQQRLAARA